MRQGSLLRLLLLAAGAGVNSAEIRDAIEVICESNPREIVNIYNSIRKRVRSIQETEIGQLDIEFDTRAPMQITRQDILKLTRRASAKPVEAAERIRDALHRLDNIDPSTLPSFNPREGLGRWIEKVYRLVGPTTLLNASISAFPNEGGNDPEKWLLTR
jgi:hypothetical protein